MSRSSRIHCKTLTGWAIALGMTGSVFAADPALRELPANAREAGEIPVVVECKSAREPGNYVLTSSDGKSTVAANIFKDRGKTYVGLITEKVPAGGECSYSFSSSSTPSKPGSGVELVPNGRRIVVRVDGRPLTEYVPDDGPKPYYFPLIGPSGAAMTRAYPMKKVEGEKLDHPHHRSFWFTHGNVNKVDFWSELPNHGTIRETSRPTVVGGAAVGVIRTTDDWVGPDGKKVCEDERVVTFYNTRATRILDFDITLKATAEPLTFGDTKEGMFGLRVASSMDVTAKKGGRILNAEGITDTAAWGKASPWVDYSGPVDGKTVGVAILNHPQSFRYPTTWHVRDYGLFAANPFGWHDFGQKTSGEFVVPAGQSIRFRYRILLHEGDASTASIPAAFQGYEASPKVTVND
jgi:Family of unknown function (DUF6807)